MTIEFDKSLRVGKHFSLGEFIVSRTHPELINGVVLSEPVILRFHYLCKFALDEIRDQFGPVVITSGFRTTSLNDCVGGAKNSQHLNGEAADFVIGTFDEPKKVYEYVTERMKWPGEFIWYDPEKRFHIALPRIGVKSDYLIKQGKMS